jgi:hypothetical protein
MIPDGAGHVELVVELAIQPVGAVEAVLVRFSDFDSIARHRLAFPALERLAIHTSFDCMREPPLAQEVDALYPQALMPGFYCNVR